MKIPAEVSTFLDETNPILVRIGSIATPICETIAQQNRGFYLWRIKSAESLAQKLQKGDIGKIEQCDDLYAGTIVIPERDRFATVLNLLQEEFNVRKREATRVKRPTEFVFDDIRLNASIKRKSHEAEGPVHGLQFELQVKTLLQHAIAVATHDILYKGDVITSRRIRMAAQLRAVLEMAEAMMSRLDLADQILDIDEDPNLEARSRIGAFIVDRWIEEDQPRDIRRAAITVEKYLQLAQITFNEFSELSEDEHYRAVLSLRSVSPIEAILAVLIDHCGYNLLERIAHQNVYFLISAEAEEILPQLKKVPANRRIVLTNPYGL